MRLTFTFNFYRFTNKSNGKNALKITEQCRLQFLHIHRTKNRTKNNKQTKTKQKNNACVITVLSKKTKQQNKTKQKKEREEP